MDRKLCVLTLGALALFGCGSDPDGPASATGTGGFGTAGTGGIPAVGTGGSNVVPPGAGGSVTPGGTGGMIGGGGTPLGAGGSPGTGGAAPTTGGAGPGGAGGGGGTGEGTGGTAGSGGTAGTGGTLVTGGTSGAGGGGGMGGVVPSKPPCLKNGSQVVFLGDSYVNYDIAHPLLPTLVAQRASMAGALTTGQTYRNYAVAGATMAAASLNMIPPQWPLAKMASADIKTVIMTGGGNDVLINNPQCKAAGAQNDQTCKNVVQNTVMAVGNLITDFKKTGVHDLIYFFYPHPPTGGNDISDYAFGMLQNSAKLLTDANFRMFPVDTVPSFAGHPDYFYIDGIHANAAGEGVIADDIWKVMKDNCIAQPASSMCCEP